MTVIEDEARSVVWAGALGAKVWAWASGGVTGLRHVVGPRVWDRVSLAQALMDRLGLEGRLKVERRREQPWPHLGKVDLRTLHGDGGQVAGIEGMRGEAGWPVGQRLSGSPN